MQDKSVIEKQIINAFKNVAELLTVVITNMPKFKKNIYLVSDLLD
jgi:hypothetical protein